MADLTYPVKSFVLAAQEFWLLMWHSAIGLPAAVTYRKETFRQIYSIGVTATPLIILAALRYPRRQTDATAAPTESEQTISEAL